MCSFLISASFISPVIAMPTDDEESIEKTKVLSLSTGKNSLMDGDIMKSLDMVLSRKDSDYKRDLINEQRKVVLQNLELDIVSKGLHEAGDMLYLAFLSVEGFATIKSNCIKIHDNFGELCGETKRELKKFSSESKKVQENLYDALDYLFGEDIDFEEAQSSILSCTTIASTLSKSANTLGDKFKNLATETVEVQKSTVEQKGISEEEKKKVEQDIVNFNAEQASLVEEIKNLKKQKEQFEKLYKQAAEDAKDANDKAFGLAIVSAIMQPIGAGLGVAAKAMTTSPINFNQTISNPDEDSSKKDSSSGKKATNDESTAQQEMKLSLQKEELEEKKKKVSDKENLLKKKEDELKKIQDQYDAIKDKEGDLTEEEKKIKTEKNMLDETISLLNKELLELREAYESLRSKVIDGGQSERKGGAVTAGVGKALEDTGANMGKISSNYSDIASQMRQERDKYFDLLVKKQDAQAKAIGRQRELMVRVQTSAEEKDTLKLAILGLQIATGALSKVAVTLRQVEDFWLGMGDLCDNLSSENFSKRLKTSAEKYSKDSNQNLADIIPAPIQTRFIEYYAGWKAVEEISSEFSTKAGETQEGVWKNFQESLHGEDLYKRIKDMTTLYFSDYERDYHDCLEKISSNKKQIKEREDSLKKDIEESVKEDKN